MFFFRSEFADHSHPGYRDDTLKTTRYFRVRETGRRAYNGQADGTDRLLGNGSKTGNRGTVRITVEKIGYRA